MEDREAARAEARRRQRERYEKALATQRHQPQEELEQMVRFHQPRQVSYVL